MSNDDLTEQKCSQKCSDINSKSSNHKTCKNYTWELVQDKYPFCDLHIEKSNKVQRWKSTPFKIFSSSCQNTIEDFDSCSLENYSLGSQLNITNTIKVLKQFSTDLCKYNCTWDPECLTYSALGHCSSKKSCDKIFNTEITEQECNKMCTDCPKCSDWQPTTCTLSNYAQKTQSYYNLLSEEDCSDQCNQLKNCTFHSWNHLEKTCTVLTELKGNPKTKYFCQKDNAKVTRKEVLCKSTSDVLAESWVALRIKTLKDSTIIKSVRNLADCWLEAKAKDSPFFYWNSTLGTCSLSNKNTQVCTTPAGSKCFKNESIPEPEKGSLTVRMDKCQVVGFKPNQCNDPSLTQLNSSDIFQCAALNESACYFYNLCKKVDLVKTEESWAFNQNRKLEHENVALNVKSVSECWKLCHNCSFFSWNPQNLECQFSNENTEICTSTNLQDAIFRAENCSEKNLKPMNLLKLALIKANLIENSDLCHVSENITIGQNDLVYSCAKNENDSVVFYKHYEYNIWVEFVISPWTLTCIILCVIYILVGSLTLIYLYKFSGRKADSCEIEIVLDGKIEDPNRIIIDRNDELPGYVKR